MSSIDVPKRLDAVDDFAAVAREVAGDMEGIFGVGVRRDPSVCRHRRPVLSRAKRFLCATCLMLAGAATFTIGSGLYADGGTTRRPGPETETAVEVGASRILDNLADPIPVAAPDVQTGAKAVFVPGTAPVAQASSAAERATAIAGGEAPRVMMDAAAGSPPPRQSDVSLRTEAASAEFEIRTDRIRPGPANVRIVPQPKPAPPVGEKIVSRLEAAHSRPKCVAAEPACMAARLALADQQLVAAQNRALAAGVKPSILRSYSSEWRRARSESTYKSVDALQLYQIIISDFAILTEDAEARRVLRSR